MTVAPLTLPSLSSIRASLARESLPEFVRAVWPIVEPGKPLSWNWHLDELCSVLQSITRGDLNRVIINIPPGCMKSMLVSVIWPCFEWASDPSLRYLTAAYSDKNTIRDNLKVRRIVQSDWFRRHFDLELSSDQWAKVRFNTKQTGWRIATSVGGMGTGEHPHRIIIDDPLKAQERNSQAELRTCQDWFDQTISTRIANNPAIVLIMQRLHEDDLAGHLLSKGGWEHVMFPMRFDPDRADSRDRRTEAGELLWPELWPEDKVRREELDLGQFGRSGQLQQNPVPEGGGLFRREWFPVVDIAPSQARRCRGWDTAATDGGGDWTVGVRLAETQDRIVYIEHVERAQLGPGGVDQLIRVIAQQDGRECKVREEREGGSAGKSVVAARARELAGYDYAGVPVTGDKTTRAQAFRAQCEAGNVRMVRGEWNAAYLDVMCSFPVGRHDDDVDATSCAYNALVEEPGPKKISLVWGRQR